MSTHEPSESTEPTSAGVPADDVAEDVAAEKPIQPALDLDAWLPASLRTPPAAEAAADVPPEPAPSEPVLPEPEPEPVLPEPEPEPVLPEPEPEPVLPEPEPEPVLPEPEPEPLLPEPEPVAPEPEPEPEPLAVPAPELPVLQPEPEPPAAPVPLVRRAEARRGTSAGHKVLAVFGLLGLSVLVGALVAGMIALALVLAGVALRRAVD